MVVYFNIPSGVCLSVHPSAHWCLPFPIDNLSIFHGNSTSIIADEWYGVVNEQNSSMSSRVSACNSFTNYDN